jgi:hypothetical protein
MELKKTMFSNTMPHVVVVVVAAAAAAATVVSNRQT